MSRENIYQKMESTIPKGTMIIEYAHSWGGQFQDKKFWCGRINGEVEDWQTKNELIEEAKEMKIEWAVLKYHKDGRISIVESSSNIKRETFFD